MPLPEIKILDDAVLIGIAGAVGVEFVAAVVIGGSAVYQLQVLKDNFIIII